MAIERHSLQPQMRCGNIINSKSQAPSKVVYPASYRNLEIVLAETNTTFSDIMFPY